MKSVPLFRKSKLQLSITYNRQCVVNCRTLLPLSLFMFAWVLLSCKTTCLKRIVDIKCMSFGGAIFVKSTYCYDSMWLLLWQIFGLRKSYGVWLLRCFRQRNWNQRSIVRQFEGNRNQSHIQHGNHITVRFPMTTLFWDIIFHEIVKCNCFLKAQYETDSILLTFDQNQVK